MPAHEEMRGVHASAVVLAGVVVANAGNYAFHLIATRTLGPSTYGSVVSLLAVNGLIGLPLAGLQIAAARHVAGFAVRGDERAIRALFGRMLLWTAVGSAALMAVFLALSPVIRQALGVHSESAVALTAILTLPSVVTPVIWGVAQGVQRFSLLSISMGLGTVVRVVFVSVFALVGFKAAGAMGASLLGASASFALAFWPLRSRISFAERSPIPARELVLSILPVVVGLLAITAFSSVDVIVAKAALGDTEAGVYGGASLIGRVLLYVPTAVAMVLLPKVASRVETDRDTREVVAPSLLVTFVFCIAGLVVYSAASRPLATLILGHKYAAAGPLLWMFALAMTGYALLNILLMYHLGRGVVGFAWVLLGAAALQIGAYAVFHGSPRDILTVSIATAGLLLLVHELFFGSAAMLVGRWLREAAGARRSRSRELTAGPPTC